MARTGRQTGNASGPGNAETILSTDGFDRQVLTVGPADGTDVDSIGGLTETAPGTDTASSGLNGRLQRVAQLLSALISLLPTALTGSGNLKTAIVEATATLSTQDVGVTPAAGTVSQIATGGTAVTVITGPCNGGYVTNPTNLTRQGIGTAEPLYLDMVGTPLATEAGANGTTSPLDPGQTFTVPPLASGVLVKVNAATTGHKFTVEKW